MGEFVLKGLKYPRKRKSLRVRMVKQLIKEFIEDFLFDEMNNDFKIKLEDKIKQTFSFKCVLVEYEMINGEVIGKLSLEKENGELTILNFSILPSISKVEGWVYM
jgi:hypothetical protein